MNWAMSPTFRWLFPIPLVDNQLAPAHPAGPAKFIYAKSPHVAEAEQDLAFLAQPDNLPYLLDKTPAFIAHDFTGLKAKWTPEQQAFRSAYPAKTIVYQDAVNHLNPQWTDPGNDDHAGHRQRLVGATLHRFWLDCRSGERLASNDHR